MVAAQKAFVERASDRPAFRDPAFLFASEAQALDASMERLNRAVPAVLEKNAISIAASRQRLVASGPHITEKPQAELSRNAARLDDLSPIKMDTFINAINKAKEVEGEGFDHASISTVINEKNYFANVYERITAQNTYYLFMFDDYTDYANLVKKTEAQSLSLINKLQKIRSPAKKKKTYRLTD
jgi:hypothetical protein